MATGQRGLCTLLMAAAAGCELSVHCGNFDFQTEIHGVCAH